MKPTLMLLCLIPLLMLAAAQPKPAPAKFKPYTTNIVFRAPPVPGRAQGAAVVVAVTITNTNPPPLPRTNFSVAWMATNVKGFSTYIWLSSTNGRFTNVEAQVTPNGLPHTNTFPIDPKLPVKLYRLDMY